MIWPPTRRWATIAIAAVVAVAVVDGRLSVAGATEAEAETESGWAIVGSGADCPQSATGALGDTLTLPRTHVICLYGALAEDPSPAEPLQVGDDGNRLVVDPEWTFPLEELAKDHFEAEFGSDEPRQTVRIDRELRLEVTWGPQAEATSTTTETTTRADTTTTAQGETTGTTAATTESQAAGEAETDAGADDVQRHDIGPAGTTKTIAITGADAPDLSDPAVAEQFIVRDPIPSSLRAEDAPSNTDATETSLAIPIGADRRVSYRLVPRDSTAQASVVERQQTELLLDDVVLVRSRTQELTVGGSPIKLTVTDSGFDEANSATKLTITVANTTSDPLSGDVTLTVEVPDPANFQRFENPTEGGQIEEATTIRWIVPRLAENESAIREVDAKLVRSETDRTVTWNVGVTQPLGDESIQLAATEASTEIPGRVEPRPGTNVDFTPGQLIRLIAFVISFALMAIIFGAWSRTRRVPTRYVSGAEAEAVRAHEATVFKSFAETIIVLVIIVSILVLALEGSLQAESAASLIGVIAGYALGQRR